MVTVMAFGTFDRLHKGHVYYLKQARRHGDELVVVVARDVTVEQVKGRLPVHAEAQRLQHLMELGIANKVVLGNHDDKLKVVEEFQPGVICLGYDQLAFTDDLQEKLRQRGLSLRIVRIGALRPEIYKSSLMQ